MGAAMRREGMGRGTASPSGLNDLISPALMAEGLPVLPPMEPPPDPQTVAPPLRASSHPTEGAPFVVPCQNEMFHAPSNPCLPPTSIYFIT